MKDGGGWVVRLYFNPLVRLIWLGAIVMALGGALSLSDRRLRIGAPRRARRTPSASACAAPRAEMTPMLARTGLTRTLTVIPRRRGTQLTVPRGVCSRRCYALFLRCSPPAHAVEPGEMLQGPRARGPRAHLSQELRCLVCQNQSIDDCNAELARDLRVLVRERLAAGDSDAAVLAFVEARYGEFVLLRPRLKLHTLAAVAGPAPAARRRSPSTSSAAPASAPRQRRRRPSRAALSSRAAAPRRRS